VRYQIFYITLHYLHNKFHSNPKKNFEARQTDGQMTDIKTGFITLGQLGEVDLKTILIID